MMDPKDKDKIVIAVYKDFKRTNVFKITPRLLKLVIILNSLLIVGCVIFFLGFLFQWGKNWTILEKNKVLEQELLLLKK